MVATGADNHALILAPIGRDAEIAAALLREIDVDSLSVADVAGLVERLSDGVLFVVATEETLRTSDLRGLQRWVQDQASWSDLAFIVLTNRGGGPERNPGAARVSEALGNVTFVERPFHATTFLSVAHSALRGRRRQFENRNTLDDLRESGERLATALVAGRLGSWELNVDSLELFASGSCKAIFGRSGDEPFTYSDLLSSIHPGDIERMQTAVRHTIETGEDYAIEYRIVWPDGSHHWVEIRARRVRSGDRLRMVGVSLDITDRKAAENLLLVENETLEARVAERTLELEEAHRVALDQIAQREAAEGKLRQAQKMEMIGQLTGGIAHDFNNLLMAVLSNLDLLKKHYPVDPKATRLIEGAIQGAERGASLTQRLLAFARQQDLTLVVTDMGDLVGNLKQLIERTIGSDVELSFDLPETRLFAEIDPNQVDMALLNLVVNARDAMPEGGRLQVKIDEYSLAPATGEARKYVRLSVIDTGEGMDATTLARATEPFFTTKGVGKGTGLGLSMIHGLSEQLGGKFTLSSEVGRGTTAELLFPLVQGEAEAVDDAPKPAAAPAAKSKLRVLMVDDDFLISMSTVEMLEDLGYEVLEAHSGEAALRVLEEGNEIDLMITDFSMPRMNGAQLANAARNIHPDLPILLATGYAELPSGEKIDLPRLSKPYGQGQLQAQIEALMAEAK